MLQIQHVDLDDLPFNVRPPLQYEHMLSGDRRGIPVAKSPELSGGGSAKIYDAQHVWVADIDFTSGFPEEGCVELQVDGRESYFICKKGNPKISINGQSSIDMSPGDSVHLLSGDFYQVSGSAQATVFATKEGSSVTVSKDIPNLLISNWERKGFTVYPQALKLNYQGYNGYIEASENWSNEYRSIAETLYNQINDLKAPDFRTPFNPITFSTGNGQLNVVLSKEELEQALKVKGIYKFVTQEHVLSFSGLEEENIEAVVA